MREELLNEIREDVVAQLIERSPWFSEVEIQNEGLALRDLTAGYGPFTELLATEKFSDFFFNGNGGSWINRGNLLERYIFEIPERLLINFVRTQALRAGKHFDQAHPAIDLELGPGIRLHALLPPIIEGGIHLSIRVNQQRSLVPRDDRFQLLSDLIIHGRRNFLISGGTGSGKTTLLAHLLEELPLDQRILVIEDTHEIIASHPHLLRMHARERNSEGAGEISVRDLIRQALRMKPDRIFLGEVRGADVLDLFLALNTGHAGSGGTIHANSPQDIPNRIAALAMTAGITREGALALFGSAIDIIIHLDGAQTGSRITSISKVVIEDNQIKIHEHQN
jgi:pilus assembly protein CpaF